METASNPSSPGSTHKKLSHGANRVAGPSRPSDRIAAQKEAKVDLRLVQEPRTLGTDRLSKVTSPDFRGSGHGGVPLIARGSLRALLRRRLIRPQPMAHIRRCAVPPELPGDGARRCGSGRICLTRWRTAPMLQCNIMESSRYPGERRLISFKGDHPCLRYSTNRAPHLNRAVN
jgi:hypothetical protein